jgi:ankyrin repeat protein
MGRSELHYASNEGDIQKVKNLIKAGADVNIKDKDGWTPLHFAAQAQNASIVLLLIEAGAEIDKSDSNGNTPLTNSVFSCTNDGSTIEILRKFGADPYKSNNYGQTPVGLAGLIANFDVEKFFDDLPI